MITNSQFSRFKQEFDAIRLLYKEEFSVEVKRDWKTYEELWASRIKTAARQINKVICEADLMIKRNNFRGRPPTLSSRHKALILLVKDIFQLSNRKMANLTLFFTILTGIDTSYKTIERAYSDPLVRLIIHNMFVIMIRRKGITNPDLTGDGTGYSLTITRHYRSLREKDGEKVKSNAEIAPLEGKASTVETKKDRKIFAYAFALMDLSTWMYVGYGFSLKSEMDAFEKARRMMATFGVDPNSIRLDQYYGSQPIVHQFHKETTVYVIPRSNLTTTGPDKWKEVIESLMTGPIHFLSEYYKRENSESSFSADKRCDGWKVWQKKQDRIETAIMCKGTWHNLLRLANSA